MKTVIKIKESGAFRATCIVVVLLLASPLWVYSKKADSGTSSAEPETITIIQGESEIVDAQWPTVRVAVTDPKIADVKILTPNQILLQGTKVGSTDLILWGDGDNRVWQQKILVSIDVDYFRKKLAELFPYASLDVSQSGEVLIIKGLLRKADQVVQLHDYLDKASVTYVDMTSVAGVQQVQLQVRVAEVSRTALRALGINAFVTDDDFFSAARVGSSTGGALVPSIGIGPPEDTVAGDSTTFVFNSDVTVSPLVTLFAGFPKADLQFFLQALAENQYLRILANPTLVALSGEEASFLAGGEFPVPVV
jgi:pilus assembly protein CpaC